MKKYTLSYCFILFCYLFSSLTAHAESFFGLGLEPYVGWQLFGKISQSGVSNPDTFNGMLIGGRLTGVFMETLFLGLDFSTQPFLSYSAYNNNNVYGKVDNASSIRFGAIVGLNMAAYPVRIWGGYNFIDSISTHNNPSQITDGTRTYQNAYLLQGISGNSFKFGASYTFINFVALNLEYMHIFYNRGISYTYSSTEYSNTNPHMNKKYSDYTSNVISVLLSFPFALHAF